MLSRGFGVVNRVALHTSGGVENQDYVPLARIIDLFVLRIDLSGSLLAVEIFEHDVYALGVFFGSRFIGMDRVLADKRERQLMVLKLQRHNPVDVRLRIISRVTFEHILNGYEVNRNVFALELDHGVLDRVIEKVHVMVYILRLFFVDHLQSGAVLAEKLRISDDDDLGFVVCVLISVGFLVDVLIDADKVIADALFVFILSL